MTAISPHALITGLISVSYLFIPSLGLSEGTDGQYLDSYLAKKPNTSFSLRKSLFYRTRNPLNIFKLASLQRIEIENPLIEKESYPRIKLIKPTEKTIEIQKKNTDQETLKFIKEVEEKKELDSVQTEVPLELEIQAVRQYWKNNNLFVAEDEVVVLIDDGILRAERIEFDTDSKKLIATGNVQFEKGQQYFQANLLEYNFITEKGKIKDLYGVVFMKSFSKDLKLISSSNNTQINSYISSDSKPIKNIELQDGIQIKIHNKGVNLISKSISKWRLQSPLITISPNEWRAKEMTLSNDPFKSIQSRIEARNVVLKEEKDVSYIKSEKSTLILEEQIRVPIMAKTFGKKQERSSWKFGFDQENRDGFFIARDYLPIDLNSNYSLSLQPQFLIQRAIFGKTKSYVEPNKSVVSGTVKNNITTADLFGLKAKLKGKQSNWNIDFSSDISSLKPSRLTNSTKLKLSINREFELGSIKKIGVNFFGDYQEKVWNGSLGESMIYTDYGLSFDKGGSWTSGYNNHSYFIKTGLGNYQAEALKGNVLKNSWRSSIVASLNSKYPINAEQRSKKRPTYSYKYSPVEIKPGVDFYTTFISSGSLYSEGDSQAIFEFSAWPQLQLGTFEKNFFDYTNIAIKPTIGAQIGESPFKFDNASDLKKLSFELTQQVVGAFLLSGLYEFNLDTSSNNYGDTINQQYALLWKRRAYDIKLFFNPEQGSAGLLFGLNGFNYDGYGSSFSASDRL